MSKWSAGDNRVRWSRAVAQLVLTEGVIIHKSVVVTLLLDEVHSRVIHPAGIRDQTVHRLTNSSAKCAWHVGHSESLLASTLETPTHLFLNISQQQMICSSFLCEPFYDHGQASRFWPQSGFEKGLVGLDESQTGSTLSRFLIAAERRCTWQEWINTGRDGGRRWRNACKSGTFSTKRKLLIKQESVSVTQAHTHTAFFLSLLRPQLTWGNRQMFNKYKNTTLSSKALMIKLWGWVRIGTNVLNMLLTGICWSL